MASALWICLALLVGLRGLLPSLPFGWGWGLDVQRFLDPATGWGLWSLVLLSLLPAVAKRLGLEAVGRFLVGSKRAYTLAGIGGAWLVWLLPDRVWFVGDFLMRQGNVESGFLASNYWGALPLDVFLHLTLLRPFGFGSAEAANTALRALGAVEAGCLGMLSIHFARAQGLTGGAAVAASALVFFGGHLTMFTGLGKSASELCLVVLALATFGIRAARGQGGLLPVGLAAAVGYGLHRSSLLLTPAWLLITWLWLHHRRGPWRRWTTWAAVLLPIAVAAYTLPNMVSFAARYDLSHHILTHESRQHGLLAAALAPRHLHALANLLFALAPLSILIPVLLPFRARAVGRRPEALVLLTLAASFLPALLFVHPQQGIFRDWDVFAPAGVALSALTAYLLVESLGAKPDRGWLFVPVVVGAIAASLQWLVVNSDPARGLARVRMTLAEGKTPSDVNRALTWDFLSARNIRLGRWREAADAAAHAAELAPHRRIFLMWALAETMEGDYRSAGRVYRMLLARYPDDPLAWLGIGGIAARLGHRDTLQEAMETLRSYAPESRQARSIRRYLSYYPEVWPLPAGDANPVP